MKAIEIRNKYLKFFITFSIYLHYLYYFKDIKAKVGVF